jgi:hypothetical protein
MLDKRCISRVLLGRPDERDNLEDLGVDGKITLRWIFQK